MSDLAVAADPVELANRLRPALLRLNRELRREGAALGITGGQATLLHLISRSPGAGVRELATREGMSAAGMSGHVDRLEAAGLVARARVDRRPPPRRARGHGRGRTRMLRSVRRRRTAWLAERLGRLSPAELDALDEALAPLARLLEADAA